MKLSAKRITRAFVKGLAPDLIEGAIRELIKGKTTKDFYSFLDSGSLWQKIPPDKQRFIFNYRPWDLSWLTTSWLIGAIAKENKSIAFLILSSPELKQRLESEIKEIKEKLE